MSDPPTRQQFFPSPGAKRWFNDLAEVYEEIEGPLPDVVSTAGAHLFPQPTTPTLPFIHSESWTKTLHQKLKSLITRQRLRCSIYGEEVAETYPISHTPTEFREQYRKTVKEAQEADKNLPPTPDDEPYDGTQGHVACASEAFPYPESDSDPNSTSQASDPKKQLLNGGKEIKEVTSEPKVGLQQSSSPLLKPSNESTNANTKKRKDRPPTPSDEGDEARPLKRIRGGQPAILHSLPKNTEKGFHHPNRFQSNSKRPEVNKSLQLEENIRQDSTSTIPPAAKSVKPSGLKRKRTEEDQSDQMPAKRLSDHQRAKRKRIEGHESSAGSSKKNEAPLEHKREHERRQMEKNAQNTSITSPQHKSGGKVVKIKRATGSQFDLSQSKFTPLKEGISSPYKQTGCNKKPNALGPSEKANKSLRSRLKQLARTGIDASEASSQDNLPCKTHC